MRWWLVIICLLPQGTANPNTQSQLWIFASNPWGAFAWLGFCMVCLCLSSFTQILYSILISCVMSTFGKGLWLMGLKRRISPTACFYNQSHSSLRLRPPYASTFFFFSVFIRGPQHTGFQYKFQIYLDSSKNGTQHPLSSPSSPSWGFIKALEASHLLLGLALIIVMADVHWVLTVCQALC